MGKKGFYNSFDYLMYDFTDKNWALHNYILQTLNRTQQLFKYNNLPDTIPQYCLESLLQINGFACIAKVEGKLYAFYGGLGGEPDVYYRPTLCTVANPALNLSKTFKIDEDCVILKNDSYIQGLMPLFRRYLSSLVENDITLNIACKNLRIAGVFSGTDDKTLISAQKYLDDISEGKQGVIASNEFLEGLKVQPLSQGNSNITQLLEFQQYTKASLFNELGLNSNFNMKREILTNSENEMNTDVLLPLVDNMLQTRQEDIEKINAMFGTNITVEFNSAWEIQREEIEEILNDKEEQEVTETKEEITEESEPKLEESGEEEDERGKTE